MLSNNILLAIALGGLAIQAAPQPEAKGRVKLSSWPSTTIFTTSTSTLMSTVTATATVTGVNPDCPDAAIPRRGGGKGQLAPIEKKMTTIATTNTLLATVTATTTTTIETTIYPECPEPSATTPTEPRECGDGKVEDLLIFDGYMTTDEGFYTPTEPFTYKAFTFDDGWGLANCGYINSFADDTCIPDTIEGDRYLALYGPATGTKPTWRRITYDYENDNAGFDLLSFYVSTEPSLNETDYRSIIYCGWTIADQMNEASPTWCKTKYFNGPDNNLQKVELTGMDTEDLAFIEFVGIKGQQQLVDFGDVTDNARAKGNTPIQIFVDDITVCVPE